MKSTVVLYESEQQILFSTNIFRTDTLEYLLEFYQ
jgi:hypothetical protein